MDHNNLYIISKVTPVFPSGILPEYVVSEDFFSPLNDLITEFDSTDFLVTNSTFDKQTVDEKHSDSAAELLQNDHDCSTESFCLCLQNLAFVNFKNRIKVTIDAILFSIVVIELKRSRTFRKNVLSNFFKLCVRKKKIEIAYTTCIACSRRCIRIHAIVYLITPKRNVLDYKWNRKVQILANERCELENAMAWLSTLGGAFSALGDTYIECAERAGAISLQQLYIALRLGDPLTICRCKIYMAMSLLQRGYYKKAKHMIRELYKFSTEGEGSRDFRLKNMCLAVWNRLRYLSQKKIKIKSH